jgi:hypothetical protein
MLEESEWFIEWTTAGARHQGFLSHPAQRPLEAQSLTTVFSRRRKDRAAADTAR